MNRPLSLAKRLGLTLECVAIFFGLPGYFYFYPKALTMHLALWGVSIYALVWMSRQKDFSWRLLWQGVPWARAHKKTAIVRFCIAVPLLIFFTWFVVPERMLSFPIERPLFWLLVMLLYPLLSVVPQEVVFRSFFFRRYPALFKGPWTLIAASAFVFGFIHIVFHNMVSPTFSFIGGIMFAQSYTHHRSLKWAALEHAAYGCMVFTIGVGFYFLVGGVQPHFR